MNDLKLISKSEEEIQKQIQTLKTFSDDIHMEFGLGKCAEIVFKKVKLVQSQNLIIDINREIREQLRIEESEGIQNQETKERLKKGCSRRLRMILKSKLNAKNKITAIGPLAVRILRYSFCIINEIRRCKKY
jgi:hypothetical protein